MTDSGADFETHNPDMQIWVCRRFGGDRGWARAQTSAPVTHCNRAGWIAWGHHAPAAKNAGSSPRCWLHGSW